MVVYELSLMGLPSYWGQRVSGHNYYVDQLPDRCWPCALFSVVISPCSQSDEIRPAILRLLGCIVTCAPTHPFHDGEDGEQRPTAELTAMVKFRVVISIRTSEVGAACSRVVT